LGWTAFMMMWDRVGHLEDAHVTPPWESSAP